jgi:two-component system, chemotaxis family, sensor kinase CheA
MSSLPTDFETEVRAMFLQEATDYLEQMETLGLDLEKRSKPDTVERIFRLMHTIKGSAAGVGFKGLADLAHHSESLLVALRVGKRTPDELFMKAFFATMESMALYVVQLKKDSNYVQDCSETINLIQKAETGEATLESIVNVLESASDGDIIFDTKALADFNAKANNTNSGADSGKVGSSGSSQSFVAVERSSSVPSLSKEETVRVSAQKIDDLMNLIGEIVILQNMFLQERHLIKSKSMQTTFSQLHKLGQELQSLAMRLRLIPVHATFQRMRKIARDASTTVGKSVDFVTEGENTEMDRLVLERLYDPLVHMIRNSVDHGIEDAAERKAAGKNPTGTIKISAGYKGDKVLIKVSDDGKGIDPKKILASAVKKGLVKKDPIKVTDAEAMEYLFMSGFSTREQVTSLSGRGVGMDVVRTSVRQLGGDVRIESVVGQGSVFYVELPLTLAIIDGITVKCGAERFVIPATHVAECLRPLGDDVKTIVGRDRVLNLRGRTVPLVSLMKTMKMEASEKENQIAIVLKGDADEPQFAVEVDEIEGRTQVVTKRLGEELGSLAGVSGAAILGDGRTALILDMSRLARGGVA